MNDTAVAYCGTCNQALHACRCSGENVLPFRKPFYKALIDLIEQYPDLLIPDAVYTLRRAIKILQNGNPK